MPALGTMYAHVPSCPFIDDTTRRELAHRLFRLGALNFSGVRLKTGELSPVYFDIRLTMSDPALLVSYLGALPVPLDTGLTALFSPSLTCSKRLRDICTKW